MELPFKNGVPSPYLAQDFRTRHRHIIVRSLEQKDAEKLHAKSTDHVASLKSALQLLFRTTIQLVVENMVNNASMKPEKESTFLLFLNRHKSLLGV